MNAVGRNVRNRMESWLTGLPEGGPRPEPPAKTELDASFLRAFLGPFLLIVSTPILSILFWIACRHHDGSFLTMMQAGIATWVPQIPLPTTTAVAIVAGWTVFQLLLLELLPGKTYLGPVTPGAVQPEYRLNGMAAWFISHGVVLGGWYTGLLDVGGLYPHYGEVLMTLCLFALGFCGFLYWKGRTYPTSPDAVYTGHFWFDFFQGIELHPRIFGVNLKQLINCRVSMMGWSCTFVAFAIAQYEMQGFLSTSMAASTAVLVIYLFKFFWWESGYFASIDIMHDRFGYYICWGVLVWVPALYCLPALFLVEHPVQWHPAVALAIVAVGVLAIWINYEADHQRQHVRETNGDTTIWGKPPELIHARYTPADGVERESILLVSGWWGVARHFHYVPELMLAAAWTIPAGFTHVMPWFYWMFLFILLMDRAARDEKRCAAKYGTYWDAYVKRVPYRVVPGIY